MPPHRAILAIAEWCGGATKPDGGRHGSIHDEGKRHAGKVRGEAVTTAVFILNRAPTKALKGKTPFEAWHGRKPNVFFLFFYLSHSVCDRTTFVRDRHS